MCKISFVTRVYAFDLFGPMDRSRYRNYELEHDLEVEHGGTWVIAEWCPSNGIYCSYWEHAPVPVLKLALRAHEKVGYTGAVERIQARIDELAG